MDGFGMAIGVGDHLGHDLDGEAVARSCLHQKLRRTAARLAEVEVIAHHRARNAEALDQDLGDKVFRREARDPGIEGHDHHPVETEPRQAAVALGLRRQAEHRAGTGEEIHGMGLEGEDSAGFAEFAGQLLRAGDDGGVAAMDPVEIADGDHRACEAGRGRERILDDNHGAMKRPV